MIDLEDNRKCLHGVLEKSPNAEPNPQPQNGKHYKQRRTIVPMLIVHLLYQFNFPLNLPHILLITPNHLLIYLNLLPLNLLFRPHLIHTLRVTLISQSLLLGLLDGNGKDFLTLTIVEVTERVGRPVHYYELVVLVAGEVVFHCARVEVVGVQFQLDGDGADLQWLQGQLRTGFNLIVFGRRALDLHTQINQRLILHLQLIVIQRCRIPPIIPELQLIEVVGYRQIRL